MSELLNHVESGFHLGPVFVSAPAGIQQVGLGLIMLVVLIGARGSDQREVPVAGSGGRPVRSSQHRCRLRPRALIIPRPERTTPPPPT